MTSQPPKLHKLLADAGLGSRREIERWIEEGRVTVNDHIAQLGERTPEDTTVLLDGIALYPIAASKTELPSTLWVYHKPIGEVCTRHDPHQRATVFDHLPPLTQQRWISIGRLDINTTGLLLFTTDGELAQRLQHPSYEIPRTYQIRVYGKVSTEICQRLLKGVRLEDGMARFLSLKHLRGEGANHWYQVTLAEGRNREVRRMWESQDIKVNRLVRMGFGCVSLPDDLLPRQGRFLSTALTHQLYQQVGLVKNNSEPT